MTPSGLLLLEISAPGKRRVWRKSGRGAGYPRARAPRFYAGEVFVATHRASIPKRRVQVPPPAPFFASLADAVSLGGSASARQCVCPARPRCPCGLRYRSGDVAPLHSLGGSRRARQSFPVRASFGMARLHDRAAIASRAGISLVIARGPDSSGTRVRASFSVG